MKRTTLIIVLLYCAAALAQDVKPSPANDALVAAAKEFTVESKSFNDAFQQARSSLDSSQKDLQKQIADAQKDLNDKLAADKKYKPILDHVKDLQKQQNDLAGTAQTSFQQKAGPMQTKIATDDALIKGLIPIVRKENGLADAATFDTATQTWKNPTPEKK